MPITADLEVARAVLQVVEGHLENEVLDREAPTVSAWTVGQQLIHLCLVASSVATALNVLIRKGGEEAKRTALARDILETGEIPRGVATAPGGLSRDAAPSEDEVRTAWSKARRRWEDLAERTQDIEGARGTLPHPLLGPLDAAEWVRFAGVHARHHLRIVDEILA